MIAMNKKTRNLNRFQNNKKKKSQIEVLGLKKYSIWCKNFRMKMAGIMNLKIDQEKYPIQGTGKKKKDKNWRTESQGPLGQHHMNNLYVTGIAYLPEWLQLKHRQYSLNTHLPSDPETAQEKWNISVQ